MRRDRLTFAMIVGIPIMQLVLFGFAINMDVRDLERRRARPGPDGPLARADCRDRLQPGAQPARTTLSTPEQINTLLRDGRISAALVIPPDFEAPPAAPRSKRRCNWWSTAPIRSCSPPHGSWPITRCRAGARPASITRGEFLQPGTTGSAEHRARTGRRDPDHDHGAVHRHCAGPRTRARQHGDAHHHPGLALGADHRQGAALRRHRPDPGHGDPDRRPADLRRAGAWLVG